MSRYSYLEKDFLISKIKTCSLILFLEIDTCKALIKSIFDDIPQDCLILNLGVFLNLNQISNYLSICIEMFFETQELV